VLHVTTREEITKDRPEKSLVTSKKRTGGRNSTGRVTSRFIGGGAKQAWPSFALSAFRMPAATRSPSAPLPASCRS